MQFTRKNGITIAMLLVICAFSCMVFAEWPSRTPRPTAKESMASIPQAASLPVAPVLSAITPNPNTVGNVTMTWGAVSGANYYYIYVSMSTITSTTSSGIFATYFAFGTSYTDVEPNGTYYYAVTAINNSGQSRCSNCQSVTINAIAPPSTPVLSTISPNPTHSPWITLSWGAVYNVAAYHVYMCHTPINSTNIDSLYPSTIPCSQTSTTEYVTQNGTWYFVVEAYNGAGSSSPSNFQSVVIILHAPRAPVLSAITPNPSTSGNVTLTWSATSGANYYYVYVSRLQIQNTSNNGIFRSFFATATTYTDSELNGIYYYAVTAINSSGPSACSNCQSVTIAKTGSPQAPILSAIIPNPTTNPHISLSWSAVANATGYDVYESSALISYSNIGILYPVISVSAPQTTYTDYQPRNGTHYYAIEAYNAIGTSPPSSCQSVVVIAPVPNPPILSAISPNPSVTGGITLSWSSVSGADCYNVYVSTSPITSTSSSGIFHQFWAYGVTYTDLEPNGTYYYAITAVNDSGESACSNCQSVNVAITGPPSAPILSAISPNPSNNPSIPLSWSAVSNAAGYYVYENIKPINSANIGSLGYLAGVPASQTTYTDYRPNKNGTFYYAIVAYNGAGKSVPSNCRSVTINPMLMNMYIGVVPGAKFYYMVNISFSSGMHPYRGITNGTYLFMLSVDNMTDHGRSATIGFHGIFSNSTNSSIYMLYGTETIGADDTNVVQEYFNNDFNASWFINKNVATKEFHLIASGPGSTEWVNEWWDVSGVAINVSCYMLDYGKILSMKFTRVNSTIPSIPRNLLASPGNRRILLAWQAPASNGGSSITNYCIYRGTSSGSETYLTTTGDANSYTDMNVTNGKIYYYKVEAVNFMGASSSSNEVRATPMANITLPSVIMNLQVTGGNAQVKLTWQAPASNGNSIILFYKIHRSTSPGNEIYLATVSNVTAYTDEGLVNGQSYYYKISAVNGEGEGNQSSESRAVPCTIPSAPQDLWASVENNHVVLSWQTPANNGGLSITGYIIYRSTSPGSETYFTLVGNITTFTDMNVTTGQTYYYAVCAVNGAGDGTQSIEAIAIISTSPNMNMMAFILIIVIACIAVISIGIGIGVSVRKTRHKARMVSPNNKVNIEKQASFSSMKPPDISMLASTQAAYLGPSSPDDALKNNSQTPSRIKVPEIFSRQGEFLQRLRDVLSGQKMSWEPFELASELGFKDDPAGFYTFVNALNGDTIGFLEGKIWVDINVVQVKKEEILHRFQLYLR